MDLTLIALAGWLLCSVGFGLGCLVEGQPFWGSLLGMLCLPVALPLYWVWRGLRLLVGAQVAAVPKRDVLPWWA